MEERESCYSFILSQTPHETSFKYEGFYFNFKTKTSSPPFLNNCTLNSPYYSIILINNTIFISSDVHSTNLIRGYFVAQKPFSILSYQRINRKVVQYRRSQKVFFLVQQACRITDTMHTAHVI
jgi:hypothetical protein